MIDALLIKLIAHGRAHSFVIHSMGSDKCIMTISTITVSCCNIFNIKEKNAHTGVGERPSSGRVKSPDSSTVSQ